MDSKAWIWRRASCALTLNVVRLLLVDDDDDDVLVFMIDYGLICCSDGDGGDADTRIVYD
mgnify:CR=1 FL=1